MNKILVFTNAQRWNQLRAEFDVDEELWTAQYNTIGEKLVLKYSIVEGTALLQGLPKLTTDQEGIYFVYDKINIRELKQLLGQYNNDNLFVLLHSDGVTEAVFGPGIKVLHGNHDTEDEHYYYPLFDLLTRIDAGDTEAKKIYFIKKRIFNVFKEAALELLTECLVPKNKLEESDAFLTLCQEEGFRIELEAFKKKYDASENSGDYKEDLARLRRILIG